MEGAGALTRTSVSSDAWQVACCDQSNAFTAVAVPAWMQLYQATPPLPAARVWHLLPAQLRDRCTPTTLVSNCYCRLAMGFSHAVHILMSINFRIIGQTLHSDRNLYKHQTPLTPRTSLPISYLVPLLWNHCPSHSKSRPSRRPSRGSMTFPGGSVSRLACMVRILLREWEWKNGATGLNRPK